MVSALVPMKIMELRYLSAEVLHEHARTMTCHNGPDCCLGAAQVIGAHADTLAYTPGTAASAAARRAMVHGLAVAALCSPGGVDFAGVHVCRDHRECGWAEGR